MGMASYFADEDISVVDMAGLKIFLKDILAGNNPNYSDNSYVEEGLGLRADDIDKLVGTDTISFEGFDDWKIISYWYPEMVMFFRDVAVFIDGYVSFNFEDEDERARIEFADGEAIIHIGRMHYDKINADELGKNSASLVGENKFKPMDEKTKGALLLRRV